MTDESAPESTFRRWVPIVLYVGAGVAASFAIFRFGMLWSMRGIAQAQMAAGEPNPFFASFLRNSAAVLWPIPVAGLLVVAGIGMRRSRRWIWLPLIGALAWSARYPIVKPPTVYYYWLWPAQSK